LHNIGLIYFHLKPLFGKDLMAGRGKNETLLTPINESFDGNNISFNKRLRLSIPTIVSQTQSLLATEKNILQIKKL
jgi:hypothetical protein